MPAIGVGGAVEDECTKWRDETYPPAIKGTFGASKGDCHFEYLSDVDAEKEQNRFTYLIRNLHEKRVLPAEWDKLPIKFNRIMPASCAIYTYTAPAEYRVEKDSVIAFGPTTKEVTPKFRTYVEKEEAVAEEKGVTGADKDPATQWATQWAKWPPPLTTTVSAKLGDLPDKFSQVDLTFESSVVREGEQLATFRYVMNNRGDPIEFSIPDLNASWSKLEKVMGADAIDATSKFGKSTVGEWGDVYECHDIRGAKQSFLVRGAVPYKRARLTLYVLGRPRDHKLGKPIATVRASLYVPVATAVDSERK
jgi:hypothetical protein